MSRVVCYPSHGRKKALKICRAFAAGCGGRVAPAGQAVLEDGPAFFYGWTDHTKALMDTCIAERRPWFFADNGYFGRGTYFRITRDALMHDGKGESGPERFAAAGIEIAPWKTGGAQVVIATQSEIFYRDRLATSREAWVESVTREIMRYSARPILVCDKPGPRPPAVTFGSALAEAWAVVGYSSNCLVEALAAGVPVFPLGPGATASMGRFDLSLIEEPYRPKDRAPWFWNLAANQWSIAEIEDGTAWAALDGEKAA